MPLNKPPKTYPEQLALLKARGVDVVEPQNHWAHRLRALLHAQTVPVTPHMGFPADWKTRPVWVRRTTAPPSASAAAKGGAP